jgi:hypothetical protein
MNILFGLELETFLARGINFSIFIVLSFLFLDVLRQLNKRYLVKLAFASLTVGCFGFAVYCLQSPVSLYTFLIGVGLFPLCSKRIRYN